jgi:heterodisulfide reductase subunit A
MSRQVAIIGAGVAGLEAAALLDSMGVEVSLIEKTETLGGHVNEWNLLFPNYRNGKELVDTLTQKINGNVSVHYRKNVTSIQPFSGKFIISASDGWVINSDAVLITTGFELFDAHRKEEYGYGIYDHVLTSADLERIMESGEGLKSRLGKSPERIGFVHCVGSRDEKAGNIYCSKVCCITAVKQAIELKELYPYAEVYCFYMDLRMFGRHYEELYKEAQEKYNIQFIRGRLSEASENRSGGIVVKVEDTLLGRPLKLTLDVLVLMVGMIAGDNTKSICRSLKMKEEQDGFLMPSDPQIATNTSEVPGIFFAGVCTGPKTVAETLSDARSAALAIRDFLTFK